MHAHTITATALAAATAAVAAQRRRARIRRRDALRRYYTDEALVEARRRIAASEPYRVPVQLDPEPVAPTIPLPRTTADSLTAAR